MHELYQLRDKLCDELKEYGSKKELSASTLTMIDTLAHALKNIDKVIEKCEEGEGGYSNRPSFESGSMRGAYGMDEYSRRPMDGSYSRRRRDAMGRYSRDDGMTAELEDLMRNAPDDRTRQKIQSILTRMENM